MGFNSGFKGLIVHPELTLTYQNLSLFWLSMIRHKDRNRAPRLLRPGLPSVFTAQ